MIYCWDKKLKKSVWVYIGSGFCMDTAEDPSLRFFARQGNE